MRGVAKTTSGVALLASVRASWELLTSGEKLHAGGLAAAGIVTSILGVVGVGGVLPVIEVLADPEAMESSGIAATLSGYLGQPSSKEFVILLGAAALALMALSLIGGFLLQVATRRFTLACQDRLASQLMTDCVEAPYKWFLNRNATVLARTVHYDVIMWSGFTVRNSVDLVSQLSLVALGAALVISVSPIVGIACLATVVTVASVIMWVLQWRIAHCAHLERDSGNRALRDAVSVFQGIKDVKLSSREGEFVAQFCRQFGRYGSNMAELRILQLVPPFLMGFLGQAGLVAVGLVLWQAGYSKGNVLAQMVLITLVAQRVIPATTKLMGVVHDIKRMSPHVEGIHELRSSVGARGSDEVRGVRDIEESRPRRAMVATQHWICSAGSVHIRRHPQGQCCVRGSARSGRRGVGVTLPAGGKSE
jgi:ABC-type multidrug transport system fused ATPase/permease subunit